MFLRPPTIKPIAHLPNPLEAHRCAMDASCCARLVPLTGCLSQRIFTILRKPQLQGSSSIFCKFPLSLPPDRSHCRGCQDRSYRECEKGQFLAPWDMRNVAAKLEANGCQNYFLQREVPHLDTTILLLTCAPSLGCRKSDALLSLMRRIPFSVLAVLARQREGMESWLRYWRELPWLPDVTEFFGNARKSRYGAFRWPEPSSS